MNAFVMTSFEERPTVADVPAPEAGSGQVLVRVHASSVNKFDLSVASGRLQGMLEYDFPVVLGKDFAGMVEAVGAGSRTSPPAIASSASCPIRRRFTPGPMPNTSPYLLART